MIRIEEGKRFSEDSYASKDEVKAVYNQEDIDSVWDRVLTYRQFFDVNTDLADASSNRYKICLTKNLLARSYNLQLKLAKLNTEYYSLSNEYQSIFSKNQMKKALVATCKFQNINVSENMVLKIINHEIENVPPSLFTLKAYESAYRYVLSRDHFDMNVAEQINNILLGNEDHMQPIYRNSNEKDIINPLIPVDYIKLPIYMNDLSSFLTNEDVPLLVRALALLFFMGEHRPFAIANESTAGLCAKAFLYTNNLDITGLSLSLESLPYTISASYFKKMKLSENTLDLTYYIDTTLSFLIYCTGMIEKEIHELKVKQTEADASKVYRQSQPVVEGTPSLADNLSYALPDFPTMASPSQVEALAKKLMEVHPHLKPRQAHFFAGHCQIGLHYTIEQFKKEEKTVYETARSSMEELANRGFYRKEQIGKRFVYTPIPIKDLDD